MKTASAIVEFIETRIRHIAQRPLMYGGTAAGVDLILHYYNELWAEALDLGNEYEIISSAVHKQQDCGSADFATNYRRKNLRAKEEDVASYVVQQWLEIRTCLEKKRSKP